MVLVLRHNHLKCLIKPKKKFPSTFFSNIYRTSSYLCQPRRFFKQIRQQNLFLENISGIPLRSRRNAEPLSVSCHAPANEERQGREETGHLGAGQRREHTETRETTVRVKKLWAK
jgi:hypothetical protein